MNCVMDCFRLLEHKQLPAPNAGGLYKINCHQRRAVL
jgi:hypothetical protein